jgi:predicted esterase
LAAFYVMAGNSDKALEVLESSQKEKIPFPIWPGAMPMVKLEEDPRFKQIAEENRKIQAELSAESKPDVLVQTPAKYSKDNTYPLFVVLHHWNADTAGFSRFWQSKRAAKRYITAFIQSSQVVAAGTFGWSDFKKAREDIKAVYDRIVGEYPVDTRRVVAGGFSQGGMMALDAAVSDVIPAAGFVVLQPGGELPEILSGENIKKAADRGLCGTLITGPGDPSFQQQKEMEDVFLKAGLDLRFVAKRGFGHGMPRGLSRLIDAALKHIEKKAF